MRKIGWVLCFVFLTAVPAWAAPTATLTWTPNTEADLVGYKIYVSEVAGVYGVAVMTITNKPASPATVTLPDSPVNKLYFFTVTAFDASNNESGRSNEVSKSVAATIVYRKTVTDAAGVVWGIVGENPSTIWRNHVQVIGRAKDLRIRNGIAEVLGTDPVTGVSDDRTWHKYVNGAWPISIVEPPINPPPDPPQGLTVAKNTAEEIIVSALAGDCLTVSVDTSASTATQHHVALQCVR